MRYYLCLFLFSLPLLGSCQHNTHQMKDPVTVSNVDIGRYLGKWYEIARFPHRFEKDLVGVTANYKRREDGKIEVVNAGFKTSLDGEYKEARGKAKIPDITNASKIKVSFFLFFYADYYILELDTVNYQYALVGSSSDNYLWILSRNPIMTDETFALLVNKAKERGYDVDKLIKVEQRVISDYNKEKIILDQDE
jgi:apolipoprotein D and lipocalin family protein